MSKILFIFLLLISTRALISCCKDVGFNFRWSKMSIHNIDVSTHTPIPLAADSSDIAHFGFRLTLEYEQVARHFIQDLAFTKTYAFTCHSNYPNKDSIDSM